jgi:hypothetical protein
MEDKQLIITVEEDVHARFKVALFYDRMGQSMFIKHVIAGYLENNKHIRAFVDEIVAKQNIGKKKMKNREKDKLEEAETIRDFGLDKEDIENIFDIIESENSDL